MNGDHRKIIMLRTEPFDKALLSEAEGLRANGINQSFLKLLQQFLIITLQNLCKLFCIAFTQGTFVIFHFR